MEIKEIKEKLDNFIKDNEDVIINGVMITYPFRYEISDLYCRFYRGSDMIAIASITKIKELY